MEYTPLRRGALTEHRVAPRRAQRAASSPSKAPSDAKPAPITSSSSIPLGAIAVAVAILAVLSTTHTSAWRSLAHSALGAEPHWTTTHEAAWSGWRAMHADLLSDLDARSRANFLSRIGACMSCVPWAPAALVLVLVLGFRSSITYQSLTPLPGLGLQLSTSRALTLWGAPLRTSVSRRFIPRADIESVVVHEALRRWNVVYYLGIVRAGDVVVAFEDVRPRLEVLVDVYHHVQEQLFEG